MFVDCASHADCARKTQFLISARKYLIGLFVCRTYLWFDEKGKKTRVAAPQYIDYVMTFTQKTISDENIFPTKYGKQINSIFRLSRNILFGFRVIELFKVFSNVKFYPVFKS